MPRGARAPKAPVHLIAGDKSGYDSFVAEEALEGILLEAVGKQRDDGVSVFHGDETSWGRILESARTRSLFVSRRAIVVRGADGLRGDHAALEAYLDDPAPDVAIALVARKVDGRKQPWKLLSQRGTIHKAVTPRGRALEGWLREALSERGLRLTPDGEVELRERVGQDLRRLSGELDKLEAWKDKGKPLDAAAVAAIIGRGMAPPFYVFGDAVAERDVARSLELSEDMLEAGESAPGLIATMYRSLRQLRMLKALEAERRPPDELVKALGLPANMAFKLKILRGAARRWPEGELRRALAALAAADRLLKLGGSDPRVVVTQAVMAALGARRGAA